MKTLCTFLALLSLMAFAPTAYAIDCGTEEDRKRLSQCGLNAKSKAEKLQCYDAAVADLDDALEDARARFEKWTQTIAPQTTVAIKERMAVFAPAHPAFLAYRDKTCAAFGVGLPYFAACCRVRATRRHIDDVISVITWN